MIVILMPMLLSLVLGLVLLAWKLTRKPNIFNILGIVAGLFCVGSGLMLFMQMLFALYGAVFNWLIVLTMVFIALPLFIGFVLLKKSLQVEGELSKRDRGVFLILGFAGLFTWSGLLFGPSIAIVVGILPNRFFKK